jgi:eukaryotic-like serine/threonine-protein kinase
VAAAHEVGIVHLDLVPDNIRVSEQDGQWQLKVLGFLGARGRDVDWLLETSSEIRTSGWTAPEQKREGYQPEASADVWSLGSLTFFALTGGEYWRTPPAGESSAALALEPDPETVPASLRAEELGLPRALPPGFDAWFSRAVCRDAARRFTDGAEAWAALSPLLSGPATTRERPRRVSVAPGIFLTAVILGVVAMGLAIYGLLRSMRI